MLLSSCVSVSRPGNITALHLRNNGAAFAHAYGANNASLRYASAHATAAALYVYQVYMYALQKASWQ